MKKYSFSLTNAEPVPILAVDDRADNLIALQAIFTDPGIKLVKARSGDEALQRVLEEEFAVILMDAQMPIMDGFETARTIRSREKTRSTPIIFLTAAPRDQRNTTEGYDIGAVDYLSKPLVPEIIRAKVAVFVELFKKTKEIRRQTDELICYKVELEHNIVQLQAVNEELAEMTIAAENARQQAVDASKFKSEFLANMSHEIRTPMNGILGMIEILLKSGLNERQRGYATTAKEAGGALLAVINDILDFSKIEAGKLSLQLSEFEPVRLVESIGELLASQAKQQSLSLLTFVDPEIPSTLRGDPGRLRQVLTNLAGNAIKFSDDGEVLIRAVLEGQDDHTARVKFSVTDHGIGLTDLEISELFKPFVQSGTNPTKCTGTGLGLSISKKLVELMEGRIGVNSIKGQGSTFWVSVPFSKAPTQPVHKVTANNLMQARVLIVDDQPGARDTICDYVTAWGMRSDTACSGHEAVNMLRSAANNDPYHVVLIDLFMPEMDGLQVGNAIREDETLNSSKLILITAFDKPGSGEEAIYRGFDAYLTKPIRQSQLLNTIATILSTTGERKPSLAKAQENISPTAARRCELILVAEDHPINQQVALLLLQDLGFEAHVADNGRKAIESLQRVPYSLVFMDCQMPEMDGFETTRSIRKLEALNGKHVPIVAMTAHAIEGNRDECLAAGMDDYISKPVEIGQLTAMIDKWLPHKQNVTAKNPPQISPGAVPGLREMINVDSLHAQLGEDGARKLLRAFIGRAGIDLDMLRSAFASRDKKEAAAAAHAVKGACATLAAEGLRKQCQRLEEAATKEDWAAADAIVKELEKSLTDLRKSISTALESIDEGAVPAN